MTVLALSATTRFGNLRYDSHVVHLTGDLALLPASSEVRCVLPAEVPVDAAPGDPAEITLGNGETESLVLTGTIDSIARSLTHTEIIAVDGAARMARARPADTLQAMSAGDAIGALAGGLGVTTGAMTLSPEILHHYTATQQRTAAEHAAQLAALGGGLATFDGEGKLTAFLRPVPPADVALLYGRELVDVRVGQRQPESDVAVIGFGGATSAADPRALQPAARALSGDAGNAAADLLWLPLPALRTPAAREAASNELRARRAARGKRASAVCWLQPQLRPGMLVEIQSLPAGVDGGPWLVTSVSHRLDRQGGYTRFEGVDGGGGLGGLLGGLASAVGGLL